MYGVFYFKLIGAYFAVLLSNCGPEDRPNNKDDLHTTFAKIIDTICDCSNFFVVMFIQNLYGSKWELLARLGHPVVPKDQQGKFIDLCLKKSFIFTLIFGSMYLVMAFGFELGGINFDYSLKFSIYKFLKNLVIVTLIFQRVRLINYYKETSTYTKINQIISEEINIRFRVVEDYFPNENAINQQIRKMKSSKDLSKWMDSKIEGSELMIQDKLEILKRNNAKPRDPIPVTLKRRRHSRRPHRLRVNYKERHFLNNFVLIWLIVDSTVFSLVCFYLSIAYAFSSIAESPFNIVLVKILMFISCLEFTMQPILFYHVLKDKRVLGQENSLMDEARLESYDSEDSRQNRDSLDLDEPSIRSSLLVAHNRLST